jgi:SAM-dependent methyltransferase
MSSKAKAVWEDLGNQTEPNWYLDPLVARAKRRDYLRLIERWMKGVRPGKVLKTDLFEEAFGEDQLLFDLFPDAQICGIDVAFLTVKNAKARVPRESGSLYHFGVADVRALPVRPRSLDLILSTSSLDHFSSRDDFDKALEQIVDALGQGGRLILTLDNSWNPLYLPLKWLSRGAWSPFPLGYTLSLTKLKKALALRGLSICGTDCLVHNPRLLSTLLFLGLRKIMGRGASPVISVFLKIFSWLDYLPSRYLSACFIAVIADKT